MKPQLERVFAEICASIDGFGSSQWAMRAVVGNTIEIELYGVDGHWLSRVATFGPFSWDDSHEINAALDSRYSNRETS